MRSESDPRVFRWASQESSSADLQLALRTLEHLSVCESLKALIPKCRYRLNRDISDLQYLFNDIVPQRTQFACKSWSRLVCRVKSSNKEIFHALDYFIRNWLCHWIVAMGLMGEVDAACSSLNQLERWMVCNFTLYMTHSYSFCQSRPAPVQRL